MITLYKGMILMISFGALLIAVISLIVLLMMK